MLQNSGDIAREKAKAVYYALLSNAMTIIRDIIKSTREYYESEEDEDFKIEFPDEEDFKIFLGNEVGIVMCLISTREAYERFFKDKKERELFTATLLYLFKNYLRISQEDYNLYLRIIEIFKIPKEIDINLAKLFGARIIAFLRKDKEPWKDKKAFKSGQWDSIEYIPLCWLIKYGYSDDCLLYEQIYVNIFKMVMQILELCASEQADMEMVQELSKKADEYIAKKDKIEQE